jgi:threonine aldolase
MGHESEKVLIAAQVSAPMRNELARLADDHDRSMSAEIRQAITLHLRAHDGRRTSNDVTDPARSQTPAVRETSEAARQSNSRQPAGAETERRTT